MTTEEPPYPLLDDIQNTVRTIRAGARRLSANPTAAETHAAVLDAMEIQGQTLELLGRLAVDVGRLRVELRNHGVEPPSLA